MLIIIFYHFLGEPWGFAIILLTDWQILGSVRGSIGIEDRYLIESNAGGQEILIKDYEDPYQGDHSHFHGRLHYTDA